MTTTTVLLDLCEKMINAQSKAELEAIKKFHREESVKEAWGMLDDSIKARIKALCKPADQPEKPSPRLWELAQEIDQLEEEIALIQDDPDLSTEEREVKLQETFSYWLQAGNNFDSKAEKVAAFIQHQESLAEARKAEAQRLSKLAGQAGKQAERLRHYLANEMVKANKKSVKGVKHHLSLGKKPPRVVVNCEPSQLPPEYVKVEYTPKLTKIKDLLKSDSQGAIDWASLSESHEYSVTIR